MDGRRLPGRCLLAGLPAQAFPHYSIREIAVVSELAAFLHAPAQRQGLRIECERAFPLALDVPATSIPEFRQEHVDITIGPLMRVAWLGQQYPSIEEGLEPIACRMAI